MKLIYVECASYLAMESEYPQIFEKLNLSRVENTFHYEMPRQLTLDDLEYILNTVGKSVILYKEQDGISLTIYDDYVE